MKIFLTRRLHDHTLKWLKDKHVITIHTDKFPIPKSELLSKIQDVDGIICFPGDIIDAEIIDAAKNLKVISTCSVGYDHIDVKYAKNKNIKIGYTPKILTDATADLAISLILDVARKITQGDRIIRSGEWTKIYQVYENLGMDLQSKTLGILGMGRIGKAVAKRAKSFGMNIIYHNRNKIDSDYTYVDFIELVKTSDIISIHVPLNESTKHMFNSKIFHMMKNESILINTARGGIVNQNDLCESLQNGDIAGAGLDVFDIEPIKVDDPLIKLDNVVLVPHIGSSTVNVRSEMSELTVKNLELGLEGKEPIYSI